MSTVPADAPAWTATGYETVRALVRGTMTHAGGARGDSDRARASTRSGSARGSGISFPPTASRESIRSTPRGKRAVTRWLGGLTGSPE